MSFIVSKLGPVIKEGVIISHPALTKGTIKGNRPKREKIHSYKENLERNPSP